MKELMLVEQLKRLAREYSALMKISMIQMEKGNVDHYIHTLMRMSRVKSQLRTNLVINK